MKIYYNNSTVYDGIEDRLRFVAWEWRLRTGVAVEYAGLSSEPNIVEGAVLVRAATPEEWKRHGFDLFTPSAFAAHNGSGSYAVCNNPYFPAPTLNLMRHEIGHCLRQPYFHSTDERDVLYPTVNGAYGLTNADVLTVADGIDWPVVEEPEIVSGILTPDMGIWHPEVQGNQGFLAYKGRVDGYHEWKLAHISKCSMTTGLGVSYFKNGHVYLELVRSPSVEYRGVHLERVMRPDGTHFRLVKIESLEGSVS